MNRYFVMVMLFFALFGGLMFAGDEEEEEEGAAEEGTLAAQLENIKSQIETIVPIVSLVMIVLAGLVYAAGQVMGAEMRSRASVWATSLIVGAIIGLVLAASANGIVGLFSGAALITE